MPKIATFIRTVQSGDSVYRFEADVYRSESPEEQIIDAGFYEKWVGAVHDSTHHEFLIVDVPSFEETGSNLGNHVYTRADTGQKFVCWTHQIKTLDMAATIFDMWCVGMIYSLENQKDFRDVASPHPEKFLEFFSEGFGIRIVS